MFFQAPNVLGFTFGMAQMILYLVYKNTKRPILPEYKLNDMPNRVAAANDEIILATENRNQTELKTGDTEKKKKKKKTSSDEADEYHENQSQTRIINDRETSPESIV